MKILKFSTLACSIMTLIACAHANTPGKIAMAGMRLKIFLPVYMNVTTLI